MFRVLKYLLLILLLAAPVSAKYWNGSAWVDNTCNYYNGSAWVPCDESYYNGTAWVPVNDGTTPPPTVAYAGYPTDANGVPIEPTGDSWTSYGTGDGEDRIYTTPWTADTGGTANAINIRHGSDSWMAVNIFVCLYNGDNLIGSADASSHSGDTDAWTGYITITETTSGSLIFESGDLLRAGLCYDTNDAAHATAYAGENTEMVYVDYDNTTDVTTSPPATVVWVTSGSAHDLGAVLRYEP